jgi:hypothetical protein
MDSELLLCQYNVDLANICINISKMVIESRYRAACVWLDFIIVKFDRLNDTYFIVFWNSYQLLISETFKCCQNNGI